MYINDDGSCCAVREIADLRYFKDPHAAMLEFCRLIKRWNKDTIEDPGGFITFTGVTKVQKGDEFEEEYGLAPTYAQDFCAYIRKNRLGPVMESPVRRNRVNHPNHSVRVYVWAPNFKSLQKWWDTHRPQPIPKVEVTVTTATQPIENPFTALLNAGAIAQVSLPTFNAIPENPF